MLREAPRIEAFAWDTGDWLHVGLYTLFPGDAVLLFSGSPADDEAISDGPREGQPASSWSATTATMPISTWRSPSPSPSDPAIRALVESAVPELLAAELWARAEATTVGEEQADGLRQTSGAHGDRAQRLTAVARSVAERRPQRRQPVHRLEVERAAEDQHRVVEPGGPIAVELLGDLLDRPERVEAILARLRPMRLEPARSMPAPPRRASRGSRRCR